MEEPVYHIDVCSFLGKRSILSYQVKKGSLLILRDEILDCIQSESFYCRTGLGSLPCGICSELCSDSRPVLLS